MGICISSALLALSMAIAGHSTPHLADFSVAFLGVTLVSFMSSPVCARLPRNAGAAMSGHGGDLTAARGELPAPSES
jgi:hypothetical protein